MYYGMWVSRLGRFVCGFVLFAGVTAAHAHDLGVLQLVAPPGTLKERPGHDPRNRAYFGFDVSVFGKQMLVGAPSDATSVPGAAYLLDVATGDELYKFVPPVSVTQDFFGFSTALNRSQALVGDPGNPDAVVPISGRAFVFDPSTGVLEKALAPSDSAPGDEFGFSTGVYENLAIIGAPQSGEGPGAAYIFDGVAGTQLMKLTGSDTVGGSDFGYAVSIGEKFAVVGAPGNFQTLGAVPGAAYVFDVATGTQLFKLQPNDSVPGDEFGWSVSVWGNRALIGAPHGGTGFGSAYLFDLTTGSQISKFVPDVPELGDDYGYDVALDGNRAIVGAPGEVDELGQTLGKAYLYDPITGELLHRLVPDDLENNDEFGYSVSLHDFYGAMGAPRHEAVLQMVDTGSTYVTSIPLVCGDFDRDNDVDMADLNRMIMNFTGAGELNEFQKLFSEGDCDGDGDVDTADITRTLINWTGAQASAGGESAVVVPEPGSAALAMLGTLVMASALRKTSRPRRRS